MTDPARKSAPAQRFAVVRAAFEADPRHFRMNKLDIAAVFSYVAELEATIEILDPTRTAWDDEDEESGP